jgi:hypothetical protein
MEREIAVHIPTRTLVTACALSAALLVAGCGGDGGGASATSGGELFLQPVAAQGPDPFTDSTAKTTATPPPVTRTPHPTPTGRRPSPTTEGMRSISGATPGLYGGTHRVGSCDVERQISLLTADQAKARAFAQAAGVSQAGIPDYLRGLTSVVLRADTRVTNHGFRDGRATSYQSVLQAGTAVLVDNRGVPRVRCACGNPLKAPAAVKANPDHKGRPWSGYRPTKVIVVTPAPQVIVNITIINIENNTWIERKTGDNGDEDRIVPPPVDQRSPSPDGSSPSGHESSPDGSSESPDGSPTDCVTPTVTVTPGATGDTPTGEPTDTTSPDPSDCPTATVTATPEPSDDDVVPPPDDTETDMPDPLPDTAVPDEPGDEQPEPPLDSPENEVGPDTVPDGPDLPDGGGLIPDEPGPYSASGTFVR